MAHAAMYVSEARKAELAGIAAKIVKGGRGILAADESSGLYAHCQAFYYIYVVFLLWFDMNLCVAVMLY